MFKKKSEDSNLIALDVNEKIISVLETSAKGSKRTVENFNAVKCPTNIFINNTITNTDHLLSVLIKLISNINFKNKNKDVIFAIPEEMAIKQTFSVNKDYTDTDIENHIISNFNNYITQLDYDKAYIDFKEIGLNPKNKEEKSILLIVADKTEIDKLEDVITSSGLNPVSIDLTSYALERYSRYSKSKDEDEIIAYFDIRKERTNIHFIKNGKRVFHHESEDFSLVSMDEKDEDDEDDLNNEPSKIEEPEQKEKEVSLDVDIDLNIDFNSIEVPEDDEEEDQEIKEEDKSEDIENKNQIEEVDDSEYERKNIIRRTDIYSDFIESMINMFYTVESNSGKVNKIILAGNIRDIDVDLIKKDLDVETLIANPFKEMNVAKAVNKEILNKFSSSLTVLVGLSIRKALNDININLHDWRTEEKDKKNKAFQKTLALYIIACASIVFTIGYSLNQDIKKQESRNSEIQKVIDKDLELDTKIVDFEKEKNRIAKRIFTINSLQVERPKIVNIFTDVVKAVPNEIYLTRLNRKDNSTIFLEGVAFQDVKVFEFIKNLEDSDWLYDVKVSRISSYENGEETKNYFEKTKYQFEIEMKEEDMSKILKLKKIAESKNDIK